MRGAPIDIHPFEPIDAEAVSGMVWEVFDEHVSASFQPAGIAEMRDHVAPENIARRAQTHTTLVAWEGHLAVGVIEVRDASHVSMLFVRTSHMGQGIATALMIRAIETWEAAGCEKLTVNASLNAQSFYAGLGFQPSDEPQQVHGFAFVPMARPL